MEEDYIDGNIYSQINRKRVNDWELEDEFMSDYESDEEYSTLYSCSICKKSGMVIRDFLRHSTEHSKEERQRVLEKLADSRLAQGMAARQAAAAYGFTLQSNLKSSVSLYFCMVCGQGNLSLRNLKEHSSLHPQYVESHFCNLCQRLFADEQDLSDHLEIHLDNNDLICQYCNRKFSIIEDLESHERNHHHAEYVCTVCRQKFRSREFVLSHLRNVHSTKTVCHVCDKDFKTRTLLDEHFMTHATLSVVKKLMQCFTCDYCAKKYDSAISLQRHILFLHNDRMPYICEHCGFTTYHETPLKEHLATEHAHGGKCLCYKCGLEFRNKSELDVHMDSHVDKNKCTVCGKYFEHILDLKYHMTSHSVETDNTPVSVITVSGSCENGDVFESTEKDFVFVCNHCQEIFDNEEIYAEHIKRHVPTVSCDLCEKSFKNDIALNIHLNKVHTNKFSKPNMKYRGLPFKCAKCSAGFRLEFELEDHYITHRGIKYQCHMCFEEYNLDSDLQEHLVTHDEEIDTKVETTKVKSEKSSS